VATIDSSPLIDVVVSSIASSMASSIADVVVVAAAAAANEDIRDPSVGCVIAG
jgi:hypothetical protein